MRSTLTSIKMVAQRILYGCLTLCCAVSVDLAQTAIINVPTSDTLSKKSLYIEADFFAHFDSYQKGGFQQSGSTIVYGLSDDVEIGVNLFVLRDGNSPQVELQPNIKWRFYKNDKSGITASTGTLIFIPLNKAAGNQTSAMFYANATKTIASANEMKLTGGIYTMAGTEQGFGTKTGVMTGLEQPVTKKVTLLADWFSGKNRFGYSTVGLGYELPKKQYIATAYSFGNSGRGNNYFTAIYSITF